MSNYNDFLKDFEKSILRNKRAIEEVELIAVSKKKSAEEILPVINLGHRTFGENQLQEVIKKWPSLKSQFDDIKVHYIGSIQSKKVHQIIEQCDVIHTLDREKIIGIISEIDYSKIKDKTFFIQVNTGSEVQKSGVSLDQVEVLIQTCKNYNIKIDGLMCLPPENVIPDKHFEILQSLAKNNHLKYLSMGMTNDYDSALKYGATHIRVGTAIFGSRN
ncbi:YggS family pyridoxal phosphate-dependent enzyme [Pelagibacterales bacterium]|nr:YggS family pyridoxal phosphate-dependent enzyme [Pelagibacterales bacterium]